VRITLEDFADTYLKMSEKGCRWCLAAPKCPAMRMKANDAARRVFSNALPYEPEELAETLDLLPILEGWIKNVREFAYEEAEKGHEIPNYKLVEKRATRKWRDEETAAKTLDRLGVEAFERKLISPAAAEKALPKDMRDTLDELTFKESSGHALVHDSDKRPAVKTDARSAFSPTQGS
jgi:hypothetical protein